MATIGWVLVIRIWKEYPNDLVEISDDADEILYYINHYSNLRLRIRVNEVIQDVGDGVLYCSHLSPLGATDCQLRCHKNKNNNLLSTIFF